MPPPDKAQPTPEERKMVATYLDDLLYPCDCDNPDPGRTTIIRLNREQYNNTMRDLLGIDVRPADNFPADDSGYGFDNIGDVLTIPPILMERYLMGADKVLDEAIVTGPPESSPKLYDASIMTGGKRSGKTARVLDKPGTIRVRHQFRHQGDYKIRVRLGAKKASKEGLETTLSLDKKIARSASVTASKLRPEVIETTVTAKKGSSEVVVTLRGKPGKNRLFVSPIEIEGPFQPKADKLPPSHTAIFGKVPGNRDLKAAERIIRRFGNRAFRRPIKPAEVKRLVGFSSLP